eukprot:scaffold25486_cov161-Isochrysis_galbana.AAC.2
MLNPFRYNQASLVDWPRYLMTDPFIQLPHPASLEVQMPDLNETDTAYQYARACPGHQPLSCTWLPSAGRRMLTSASLALSVG